MDDKMTKYESRIGEIGYKTDKVYRFVSDMRNYYRFLPSHTIENWEATADSCSFEVSPVGKVKIRLIEKEAHKTVKFSGDGFNNTEFFLWIQLQEAAEEDSRVKITIKADINPMIKMMVANPVKDFLNKLIKGFESFDDWESTTEQI